MKVTFRQTRHPTWLDMLRIFSLDTEYMVGKMSDLGKLNHFVRFHRLT